MNKKYKKAFENGQKILSEYDSKKIIKQAGIVTTREGLVKSRQSLLKIAEGIGYPVTLKGCSHKLAHKTEKGMVKLNLTNEKELFEAYDAILEMDKEKELDGVLIQEMIKGDREFIVGLNRDPHFGAYVMLGLGGIYAEIFKDATCRVLPITKNDALEMIDEIRTKKLLDGFRDNKAVDKNQIVEILLGINKIAFEYEEIAEIDINPLIIKDNQPIAVDVLIVLDNSKKPEDTDTYAEDYFFLK